MNTALRAIGATILGVAILAALWFAYWFLALRAQENRYEVNTHSQQYQSALIAQERDRVAAYDVATDDAQRAQLASTFCAVYAELTEPPADLIAANGRLCF